MSKNASEIFHSEVPTGELERLSALETLKGLKDRETVMLADLVRYLDARGLWSQFAKITMADLRDAFTAAPEDEAEPRGARKRKKQRILEDELGDAYEAKAAEDAKEKAAPNDGGLESDEFARRVMPFIEGNGDVTLDDIEEYMRVDRKVLRHHLGILVKDGRLERLGVGRHAVYSAL